VRQPSTLDLRPSARSSLFPLLHPSPCEVPSTHCPGVLQPLPTPIGTHHHPVRAIVLSLSFSLGQVRLSDPSHSPYPCPQLCPCPRCLPNLTLANPSPPILLHRRYFLILYLSLSLSLAYLHLLTTFTLSSVSAPPCQFLCETTNGAIRYLPSYLAG